MFTSIQQMVDRAVQAKNKVISVAAAHDEDVLHAVTNARKQGIADAILVGKKDEIVKILDKYHDTPNNYEIIDESDLAACAAKAVELVRNKKADYLMKGLLNTSIMMRAVLDKEHGLRSGNLISHFGIFEVPAYHKLLSVTDGAMVPAPDLEKKAGILENAARALKSLGYEHINASCVCGSEVVDPKIPATVDAEALSKMTDRWSKYNMDVIGPLAFDLAISPESVKHKGYSGKGAGDADILLVPTYEVGNVIIKSLTYFAGAKFAGLILGAKVPIVLTSRSDSAQSKLASIALGSLIDELE